MNKCRTIFILLTVSLILVISLLAHDTATAAVNLDWLTCTTCSEIPEVTISGDTISLGVANRSEYIEQNNSIHGASALLPPATEYTISFDYSLFTWDSYNPISAGWTGYWDSFSVSISDNPYWELSLSDPVTPSELPGLGFIWGGTLWADGVLEHVSGSKTITIQGNPSGNNYLNIILDTTTQPHSNHLFSSWGTITVIEVRTDVGTTLPQQAANQAISVVGGDYLWGGKGWDFTQKEFVEPQQIFQGYNYWNPVSKSVGFGDGLDCSGLNLWAYNKSFGASSMLSGPIRYEGADGQFRYNSQPVSEDDLLPGDLLFFDWDSNGIQDHVAMFVGQQGSNDVVHASQPGVGIVWGQKNVLKNISGFTEFRRVENAQVGLVIQTHSPINLIVTDPDGVTITTDDLIVSNEEWLVEIPGVLYYSVDNDLDDLVIAPLLKPGVYTIYVEPKPDASLEETYSLEVEGATKLVALAQDVPISAIPQIGYRIISTGDEIAPGKIYTVYLPTVTK